MLSQRRLCAAILHLAYPTAAQGVAVKTGT